MLTEQLKSINYQYEIKLSIKKQSTNFRVHKNLVTFNQQLKQQKMMMQIKI